jgi:hypothetical protein
MNSEANPGAAAALSLVPEDYFEAANPGVAALFEIVLEGCFGATSGEVTTQQPNALFPGKKGARIEQVAIHVHVAEHSE